MPEHVTCNLCGADDADVLYSLRDYRLRADDRLSNLVQPTSATGGDDDAFFSFYSKPHRQRFREAPVLAAAWTATAAVEEIPLTDWLVRTRRISGQVVALMRRPIDG